MLQRQIKIIARAYRRTGRSRNRVVAAATSLFVISFVFVSVAAAQEVENAPKPPVNGVPVESEVGIPVTDKLTTEKCGTCHKADDKGNLTRISWIRTTPEGWEEAIKRMIRLNGLTLQPTEARHILSYLSTNNGLAPEEVEPHRWFLEMRQAETENYPSPQVRMACASCHALARPQTWHRSATEWKLLENMHVGYFPVAENNSFHARPRPDGVGVLPAAPAAAAGAPTTGSGRTAAAPAQRDPIDDALEFLNKTQTLHTAAWSNWRASMKEPSLKGRWLVSGSLPGKGRYFGVMTVVAGASPDTFKTQTTLTRVSDGSTLSLAGDSIVYTGYEWRGRSKAATLGDIREVMAISPDQSKIQGRWFWGDYQEFGFNISARRVVSDLFVVGTDVASLRAGSKGVPVKIIGENFPRTLTVSDIDLGAGIHAAKIASVKPNEIDLSVDVDPTVITGFRTVSVKTAIAPNAFAVYDKIDYIKVSVPSSVARLGGATHPKGYVQFEAIAYNRGLDGVSNTADDIDLGPVPAKWSLEEFIARFNDDDKEFVGSISEDGLFTPAGEGPNPQRRFSTNNTGDVLAVAKYQEKGSSGEPLIAKTYLIVTVPIYMKWDQPEVGQEVGK